MIRAFPLLVLALLPAAGAAPVPPGGRAEFGTNGLLSRSDLDKVPFDTRPAVRADGRDWPEDVVVDGKPKRGAGGPANRYDLAVHMPWTRFRAGEPVPAYFVLRNNGELLGLGSRMDLSGAYPEFQGGGMALDVRDRATCKTVLRGLAASTNCGGGSLVDVPARGFYCVKGDLARLARGLAPGEYEVDWRCGRLASAPVRFTIAKGVAAPPPAAPATLTRTRFFRLSPTHGEYLEPLHTDAMASALAVGQHGVYVPDTAEVPPADGVVEAHLEWKSYRAGDRLAVTLRAAAHKQVRFSEPPHLFLQVETAASDAYGWRAQEAEAEKERELGTELTTPLTIEIALPKGWREQLEAEGTARVAVLVAAGKVELPRGAGRRVLERVAKVERKERPEENRPLWGGIVRTGFAELRLPPRGP